MNLAGGKANIEEDGGRCVFTADVPDAAAAFFRPSLEDKIADVIAVNYKYEYFKRYIRSEGLNKVEYELLLAALISADLEEDKRYALSKLSAPYAIDGSFNFTMRPLKTKWSEIIGYVPTYFAREQLRDFIGYIIEEKKGKRVFVVGGGVFDTHYNKLNRSYLAGGGEGSVVKEVILSSSGEVELNCRLSAVDEFYLKEFFGDKIFFKKGYFG